MRMRLREKVKAKGNLFGPIERHHRVSIRASIARRWKLHRLFMLDAEQPRKWRGEPPLRELQCKPQSIWRIGEGDVEFISREAKCELERVATMHGYLGVRAHQLDVAPQGAEAARPELHEDRFACAARKSFQAQRARARKEIEHPGIGQLGLDDAHPCLSHAIGCRTYSR